MKDWRKLAVIILQESRINCNIRWAGVKWLAVSQVATGIKPNIIAYCMECLMALPVVTLALR